MGAFLGRFAGDLTEAQERDLLTVPTFVDIHSSNLDVG